LHIGTCRRLWVQTSSGPHI